MVGRTLVRKAHLAAVGGKVGLDLITFFVQSLHPVAADASLGEDVMLGNYVDEEDEEMRQKSNRTFRRIVASLPPEVAARYGYIESAFDTLKRKLRRAVDDEDWQLVARLAGELSNQERRAG